MSDSVGSVSVDVVPDARGWSEKLRAQIRDQTVTINADADTGEAEAQLDEVARTRTAKVKADVSQLSQGASKLDQFVGNLGLIPSLAIAAGAALIPLGAAIGGVVAAIGAPLAIAGGGAGIFAIFGGLAVKQTQEQLKAVDKLHKAADSARASLDSAKRSAGANAATSATVANAQDKLTVATRDYQIALKGISPQQRQFATALDGLKSTFSRMIAGPTGRAVLQPISDGITLLGYAMRESGPLIRASAGAISTLLEDITKQMSKPGFTTFMSRLTKSVGPDLVSFGRIAGNGIKGLTGLILALDGSLSGGVLHGLERLSGGFADLGASAGKSKGLQGFVDYFHKIGPQVADTLGSLARSIGHIVEALAPLGPPVLHIIQGIADAFNTIPIPVLTALAAATGGLIAFQKLGGLKVLGAAGRATGGHGIVSAITGGAIQNVRVVNWPGGVPGVGGGVPGVPGEGGAPGLIGKVGILGALGQVGVLAAAATGADVASSAAFKAEYGKTVGAMASRILRAVIPVIPDSSQIGNQLHLDKNILGGVGHAFSKLHAPGNIGDLFSMPSDQPSAKPITAPAIHLKSTTTEVDGLRASLARASRQIDLIGPHADNAFGAASHDVSRFKGELAGIHDVKFKVIAQTQSAISSLERLQALRIADKSFTVYQRNQLIEQTVGPGGGMGRYPGNPGPGSSAGGGAVGKIPVHIHLDDNGKRVLTGHMEDTASRVYDANSAYDAARAGQ